MTTIFFDLSEFQDGGALARQLCGEAALDIAQKLTLDTHKNLVAASPVDTGTFRAGWTVITPSVALAPGIIENAVSYGPYLIEGHSKQAPAGWFDNAILAAIEFGGQ